MKIAVVGGSGFIGTTLVGRLIEAGHQVAIVDKVTSATFPDRTIIVDVRDRDALREALAPQGFDAVYNLAAEHKDNVRPISLYDEVNVGGAQNLCDVASDLSINRLIFTSSVAVYGFAPADTDEAGAINPFNDYGRTKAAAEEVFDRWLKSQPSARSLTIVRPTVVFGPRNRGNVYNLLRQIASGAFLMIGRGENKKSMAYVENVASFLVHALTFSNGKHLFNYIDKPDVTMNELVALVRAELKRESRGPARLPYFFAYPAARFLDFVSRITGREFPVSGIRIKKFVATTQFETSVARSGFVPPVPLSEGVRRTVHYEFVEGADDQAPTFDTE